MRQQNIGCVELFLTFFGFGINNLSHILLHKPIEHTSEKFKHTPILMKQGTGKKNK